MNTEKIYCGTGKAIPTKNGELLKFSFTAKDIQTMQAHMTKGGWVNTIVGKRKEPSQSGQTHYLTIDPWKPEIREPKIKVEANNATKPTEQSFESFDDDLPF